MSELRDVTSGAENYIIMPSGIGSTFVDQNGFWFDDYVLTIDHQIIPNPTTGDVSDICVNINGKTERRFFNDVKVGDIGMSPKYSATVK